MESARRLKRWDETSRRVADGYGDMDRNELIKLVTYLCGRTEEVEAARKESDRKTPN